MVGIKGFTAVKTTIPGVTKKLLKRTTNVDVGTLAQKFVQSDNSVIPWTEDYSRSGWSQSPISVYCGRLRPS